MSANDICIFICIQFVWMEHYLLTTYIEDMGLGETVGLYSWRCEISLNNGTVNGSDMIFHAKIRSSFSCF